MSSNGIDSGRWRTGRGIWKHPGSLVFLYLSAIVAANIAIARLGQVAAIPVALLLIGLDLTTRDLLHDSWRARGAGLLWRMGLLIAIGSGLSWGITWLCALDIQRAGAVSIASMAAFAFSTSTDFLVYHILRDRVRWQRINGSNMLSAAVDSVVFPLLAFAWPLTLGGVLAVSGVIIGQFLAKTIGGLIWSLLLVWYIPWRSVK